MCGNVLWKKVEKIKKEGTFDLSGVFYRLECWEFGLIFKIAFRWLKCCLWCLMLPPSSAEASIQKSVEISCGR